MQPILFRNKVIFWIDGDAVHADFVMKPKTWLQTTFADYRNGISAADLISFI